MTTNLEQLKLDQNLRPYFLDFISKNLVLGMTEVFTVKTVDRIRLEKEYYESFFYLTEQLSKQVPNEKVTAVVEEVSKYYLSKAGRISFDHYPPNT